MLDMQDFPALSLSYAIFLYSGKYFILFSRAPFY